MSFDTKETRNLIQEDRSNNEVTLRLDYFQVSLGLACDEIDSLRAKVAELEAIIAHKSKMFGQLWDISVASTNEAADLQARNAVLEKVREAVEDEAEDTGILPMRVQQALAACEKGKE